ncbi:hypothetical protein DS901_11590 [Loktanella sp. D2R18]|uniref:hypothetical protein n=1 Tax=Rhodobacterales TaxID=204455 RepID=UPI000DE9C313|nr:MULTISPECIES: hypothetical protein [Rhodobacterales]MDO6590312.1 hypothetical protein [Yoonia sp. 1_MG-2023]RBW42883.1 hypothetical protein DS901_11590 [Loktanella sp. D2R18]
MQIAHHIGAHGIDEDRLLKSTLRNADALVKNGIAAPGPGKYRSLIRTTIQGLDGAQPAPGTRDVLLDSIVEDDRARRLLLANGNFICVPNRVFEHGAFYPQAEPKVRALLNLFPDDDLSLFFAIRHPATFLQDLLRRPKATTFASILGITHPADIRWADVVRRIQAGAPNAQITVWCEEDTPLLWPQLIRRYTGIPATAPILGGLDALDGLMQREGFNELRDQLNANPGASEIARQNMIADCWEAHAIPGADDVEIDLPELDAALVQAMTETYEADIAEISAMEGVTLVLPFT